MKHIILWITLMASVFGTNAPDAFPTDMIGDVCNPVAQQALENGRLEEAKSGFARSYTVTLISGNKAGEASCSFYLGLTAQLEARAQDLSDPRREILLEEARKWYEAVPRFDEKAGVVSNLARAYYDLGLHDKANQLFNEAIERAEGNPRSALMRSYADMLSDNNRFSDAAHQYRILLKAAPSDEATWNAYLEMVGKGLPEELPKAIWNAVEANQTLTAQRRALTALSAHQVNKETRIALFAAVVAGLSRQQYPIEEFASEEAANGLRSLTADPILGVGARFVLEVHRDTIEKAGSLAWWADKSSPYHHSPLESIRSLLRALATRVDGGELRGARRFLELADQVAPEVPDIPVYVDLAATYTAAEDLKALAGRLRRWELAIKKSEAHMAAAAIAHFHLAMSEALYSLGSSAAPDEIDSVKYQLARADEAAERSKDREVLAAVREASLRILPQPKRNEGGGSRIINAGTLDCTGGPGRCLRFKVEIPDLVPRLKDLRAGVARSAIVVRGCARPRRIAWHFSPILSKGSEGSLDIRLTRSPLFPHLGVQWKPPSGHQSKEVMLHSLSAACTKVPLTPRPLWVTTGVWDGSSSLLLADVLRGQLLRYGTDGRLLYTPVGGARGDSHEEILSRVRFSSTGMPVVEFGVGELAWMNAVGRPTVRTSLVGRRGAQGTLEGVGDWMVLGQSTVLAVGNIKQSDGSWRGGLTLMPVAPSHGFEVISAWAADDPSLILYSMGQPYLAAMNGRGYFLKVGKTVSLFEVSIGERGSPLRLITTVPGGLKSAERKALVRQDTGAAMADLFRIVESLDVPAGLYASDGFLFLLKRQHGVHSGKYSWQLERLDPKQGRLLQTTILPTSAHHLTIIPGAKKWALVERGVVTGPGMQETPSVVFVPTSVIEGKSPAAQGCWGLQEGYRPLPSAYRRPAAVAPSPDLAKPVTM